MASLIGAIVEVIASVVGLVIYGLIYSSLNTEVLGASTVTLLNIVPLVFVAVLIIGLLQIFGRV